MAEKKKRRPGKRRLRRELEAQAHCVVRRLKNLAEGALDRPATWRTVAARLGVKTREEALPLSETGYYMRRDDGAQGRSILSVNTAQDPLTQCAIWVHELAHHLLYEAQPPLPFGGEPAYHRYDDAGHGISHSIACRVEYMVLGGSE